MQIFPRLTILSQANLKRAEDFYKAEYVLSSEMANSSVYGDIFYQKNPDFTKGHGHWFLLFRESGILKIAKPDFEHVIGIVEKDTFYYSADRHDYVMTEGGRFIDGGRSYTRSDTTHFVKLVFTDTGPKFGRNGFQ